LRYRHRRQFGVVRAVFFGKGRLTLLREACPRSRVQRLAAAIDPVQAFSHIVMNVRFSAKGDIGL